MHRNTAVVITTFSALSFLASAATAFMMYLGAKRLQREADAAKTQIEELRLKTNASLKKMQAAVNSIEL